LGREDGDPYQSFDGSPEGVIAESRQFYPGFEDHVAQSFSKEATTAGVSGARSGGVDSMQLAEMM
jgi:hypothetical protein